MKPYDETQHIAALYSTKSRTPLLIALPRRASFREFRLQPFAATSSSHPASLSKNSHPWRSNVSSPARSPARIGAHAPIRALLAFKQHIAPAAAGTISRIAQPIEFLPTASTGS
jgi:hypothetical protein